VRVKLSSYPGTLRQLAVTGLGHDEPTILITNQHTMPARQVIQTYSRRMNIEQRLAEAIWQSPETVETLNGVILRSW
jgi:hypothetical protein